MIESTGIVIDRSKLTHGDALRMAQLSFTAQKAANQLDGDAFEAASNAMDALIERIVVSVPDGWLPDGVHMGEAGWLNALSQPHYETIVDSAQGEKKKTT